MCEVCLSCVVAVVKDSGCLALECRSLLYVCVRDVINVVFDVCIVRLGAVCARISDVCVFRHAYVVSLCLLTTDVGCEPHFSNGTHY